MMRQNETGLINGALSAHFAAIDADGLRRSILSRLDTDERQMAEQTLRDFAAAAKILKRSENEFNKRAAKTTRPGSLTRHLRSAADMTAVRAFNRVVEQIEDVRHGDTLVRKMRKGLARGIA